MALLISGEICLGRSAGPIPGLQVDTRRFSRCSWPSDLGTIAAMIVEPGVSLRWRIEMTSSTRSSIIIRGVGQNR